MLRSSGAMRSSDQPVAWRAIRLVQLAALALHALDQLAGEGRGTALEQVGERRPVTSAW